MPNSKMGVRRALASRQQIFFFFFGGYLSVLSGLCVFPAAQAANYDPKQYFISGSVSFDGLNDGLNASELNGKVNQVAPLSGLIGGRLKLERGLASPAWSHWVELGYFTGSASAIDTAGSFSQSVSYLGLLPLSATYWFSRTSSVDLGLSLGAGIGFAPAYDLSLPPSGGAAATERAYSGKLGPLVAGRLDGRFWINRYLAATASAGLQYFQTEFTSGNDSVLGQLTSFSLIGGLTVAMGGAQGTGRNYVEVIRDKPDTPKRR